MDGGAIYARVRQRTKDALGFPVNLHRFRHAAATLWSVSDPRNVRGAKDLLGHSSFKTTEKHYVMAQSRLAGRALALAIGATIDHEPTGQKVESKMVADCRPNTVHHECKSHGTQKPRLVHRRPILTTQQHAEQTNDRSAVAS
jgi:hypothetical protein